MSIIQSVILFTLHSSSCSVSHSIVGSMPVVQCIRLMVLSYSNLPICYIIGTAHIVCVAIYPVVLWQVCCWVPCGQDADRQWRAPSPSSNGAAVRHSAANVGNVMLTAELTKLNTVSYTFYYKAKYNSWLWLPSERKLNEYGNKSLVTLVWYLLTQPLS